MAKTSVEKEINLSFSRIEKTFGDGDKSFRENEKRFGDFEIVGIMENEHSFVIIP